MSQYPPSTMMRGGGRLRTISYAIHSSAWVCMRGMFHTERGPRRGWSGEGDPQEGCVQRRGRGAVGSQGESWVPKNSESGGGSRSSHRLQGTRQPLGSTRNPVRERAPLRAAGQQSPGAASSNPGAGPRSSTGRKGHRGRGHREPVMALQGGGAPGLRTPCARDS